MNNESKCCEKCYIAPNWDKQFYCSNPSCPCHTPAPESSAGFNREAKKRLVKILDDAKWEDAPEDWEKEFDNDLYENYGDEDIPPKLAREEKWCENKWELDPDKVRHFIRELISSREAAAREEGKHSRDEELAMKVQDARREGAEGERNAITFELCSLKKNDHIEKVLELIAARSEGVNG